jgi:hypothetical protein
LRGALLITLLLAATLRLWQLEVLPPGLFFDEAFNGLDANRVLSGDQLPFFFAGNGGREPLLIYLQVLAVRLLGRSPLALRLVSAFAGIVTVAVIYAVGRWILLPLRGNATMEVRAALPALIAATGMAVSYWHVSLSRLGFRVVLLPLTSALAVAFFWRAWTQGRKRDYLWSGFWLALALFTYLAARLLPAVILLFVSVEFLAVLFRRRRTGEPLQPTWKPRANGLLAMSLVAIVLLTPMLATFLRDPALVTTRVSEVSLFTAAQTESTQAQRGVRNALAAIRALYVQGDDSLRHNLMGRPVNDWLLAALFTVGIVTALAQIRRPQARLLVIWLAMMTLPAVLSTQPTHALRSVGMLPPLALLYGLGAWGLAEAGGRLARRRGRGFEAGVMTALWIGIIAVSGATTARDYFVRWGRSGDLAGYFQLDQQLAASKTAQLLADGSPALVSRRLFLQAQMGYAVGRVYLENALPDGLAGGKPLPVLVEGGFDAAEPMFLAWRDGDTTHAVQVKPPVNPEGGAALDFPEGSELRSPIHVAGWPAVRMGMLRPGVALEPSTIRYPLAAEFANGIRLAGYDVEPDAAGAGLADSTFRLHLFFQFEDPGSGTGRFPQQNEAGARLNDFDVFAHLATQDGVALTANGPISGEHLPYWLLSGADSAGGLVFEDIRRFAPPEDMAPGKAFFETGLYSYHPAQADTTFERIAMVDAAGEPAADALTLGGVFIGPPPADDVTGYQAVDAQFGGVIELAGWCATRGPDADGTLHVGLAWRALDRPIEDYTAFVHLVDAQGQLLAQYDRPPSDVTNPTHLWAPGETIQTDFELALPEVGLPSDAQLRIGLYEPISGRRLPLVDGADFVLLPADETGCP